MSAATDINPTSFGDYYFPMASVDAEEGDIACINAAGFLTPGAAAAGLVAIGVFKLGAENADGAPGEFACPVMTSVDKTGGRRVFPMTNSATNPLTQAYLGRECFVEGPRTVGNTSSGGTLSRGGKVWGFSPEGNPLVEFDAVPGASSGGGAAASDVSIADAGNFFSSGTVEGALQETGALLGAGMTASKKTVTVGHADLTQAVNGTAQAVNIGTALPANARIIGANIRLATPFTGGSASAVTVDIGTAGDVDAVVDGANVFAAAVDGQASTMPAGIAPNKHFAGAGAQLLATFIPDGGHSLDGLTAGSATIEVLYIVLA